MRNAFWVAGGQEIERLLLNRIEFADVTKQITPIAKSWSGTSLAGVIGTAKFGRSDH
jgi:hypothetical protein